MYLKLTSLVLMINLFVDTDFGAVKKNAALKYKQTLYRKFLTFLFMTQH